MTELNTKIKRIHVKIKQLNQERFQRLLNEKCKTKSWKGLKRK